MSFMARSIVRMNPMLKSLTPVTSQTHTLLSKTTTSEPTFHQKHIHFSPPLQAVGGHSAHWIAERSVAVSLVGIIPAAYLVPGSTMDFLLATSLVLHCHWGIAAIFQDYLHGYPSADGGKRRYPILTTLAKVIPYVLSITAFACLLNFNLNDVGLTKAIEMLWRV